LYRHRRRGADEAVEVTVDSPVESRPDLTGSRHESVEQR
jgi:hypothetical protein